MKKKSTKLILIVDDEEDILITFKTVLQNAGYIVLTASDYREALDIVNNTPLDLMLLDIMMPEVDGTALLQITKTSAFLDKPFPIVYVSAKPKETVYLKGSDGFIQKPVSKKVLVESVKKFLEK